MEAGDIVCLLIVIGAEATFICRVAYCNLIGYSEYSAHARLSKLDFKLLNFPV